MRIVVLIAAFAVFLIFTALLNGLGRKKDHERHRLAAVKDVERCFGDEELKKPFAERVLKPVVGKLEDMLRAMAGKNKSKRVDKNMEKLERSLRAAAIPLSAQEFTFVKGMISVIFVFGGAALAFLLKLESMQRLLILLVCMCIPVFGPKYYLNSRVKKRKAAIVADLPDVMDLLVVSVEAGLGLDAAITRLYAKNKCVVLTELMGSVRDVQMGVARKTSLKEMADRCDVKQLTSLVSSLIQAEQLGVSMKNVLTTQADRLRVERRQRIQEKAMKAPVKMMLPTVGFIFPVMFIVLLGPAAMSLMEAFK
ncbi:MAG: type II secretion system F family protein [Clostridia bacterium]